MRPADVEPATAVVWLVTPDAPASVRSSFCNQIHFFVSAEVAKDWRAEHRGACILPVADAYEAGRRLIEQLLSGTSAAGSRLLLTRMDCCVVDVGAARPLPGTASAFRRAGPQPVAVDVPVGVPQRVTPRNHDNMVRGVTACGQAGSS